MVEVWKAGVFAAGLAGMFLAVFFIYRHMLLKKMNKVIEQIDDTVESLIAGRKKYYFCEERDCLLGKFQFGILRLYEILCSYEEREKELHAKFSSSVGDLVHQINTPISNIKIYSEFLMESAEEGQNRVFAENIAAQAEKLSFLGEGFSKISRMEAGSIKLQPKSQALLPAVLKAIDQAVPKAQKHGNEIVLAGSQKLCADFDGKWTEEALFNLIDNAIKYSNAGSRILVELLEYDIYVRVNVANHGPAIREEEYARIFRRFYKGEHGKGKGGVGLGLYLAREIVREQRGYIKVGKGRGGETVFSVFLPKI